jgi:hypothetical protein
MKKLLIAAAACCVMSVSAFADGTKIKGLSFSLPVSSKTWNVDYFDAYDDDDYIDVESDSVSFDVNYNSMSVSSGEDWGFSFLFNVGAGYTSTTLSCEKWPVDVDLTGGNFNLKFGWGVAPLCRENIILAVHGFIAVDGSYVEGTKLNTDFDAVDLDFIIGGDCFCVIPLSDGFGLTLGLDIGVNAAGAGVLGSSIGDDEDDSGDAFTYRGSGVTVTPRLGICWIK